MPYDTTRKITVHIPSDECQTNYSIADFLDNDEIAHAERFSSNEHISTIFSTATIIVVLFPPPPVLGTIGSEIGPRGCGVS